MVDRKPWIALLLGLLLAMHLPGLAAQPAASYASLGMGFSPGSITALADGVPVYTQGDQLWLESYAGYATAVRVVSATSTVVAQDTLQPDSATLVYTFSATDTGGAWSILASVAGASAAYSLVTAFTLLSDQSAQVSMTGYNLSGAVLTMNFSLPTAGAYDIGDCLVGDNPRAGLSVPLPSSLGSGQLALARDGDEVTANLTGTVTTPFTFWTELHDEYSYEFNSNSTVVSRDLEVATTGAIDVSKNFTGAATSLEDQTSLRTGELTAWTYFESAQGISINQAFLLIPGNSTWLPLDGCSAAGNDLAPNYSVSAPLTQPTASWPREIYTMYEVDGVGQVSVTAIPIRPAAITVLASPWNESLSNPGITLIGSSTSPVQDSSVSGDTMYLTAGEYPLLVTIGLYGREPIDYNIAQPFTNTILEVNSSEIVVKTEVNGNPTTGVDVTVGEGGTPIASAASEDSEATFYLPAGNYSATGSFGNSASTAGVAAQDGLQSSVTLDLSVVQQAPGVTALTLLLVSTALVGLVASVWAWVRAYRRAAIRPNAET